MGFLFDYAQREDRELVMTAGDRLPPQGQPQASDACRIARFPTDGGGWTLCLTHDHQMRGLSAVCPFGGG